MRFITNFADFIVENEMIKESTTAKEKLIQMSKSEKLSSEIKDLLGDKEFDVLTK